MPQVNISICAGMGRVGIKRLQKYKEGARSKGYRSLSAYAVALLDRELRVELPKPKERRSPRS